MNTLRKRSSSAISVSAEAALQKNFYVCAYARFLGAEAMRPWPCRAACSLESKRIERQRTGKLEDKGADLQTLAGWWFGTSILFSHILGIIIPID